MKEFSEIAKSAHISNDAIVEYPIHCGQTLKYMEDVMSANSHL